MYVTIFGCTHADLVVYSLHKSLLIIVLIDVTSKIPFDQIHEKCRGFDELLAASFCTCLKMRGFRVVPNTVPYDFSTLK